MNYFVDEKIRKKHLSSYRAYKIKKRPFSFIAALIFFILPFIISNTIILLGSGYDIGTMLLVYCFFIIGTSALFVPIGIIFYKNTFRCTFTPEEKRLNETIALHSEHLEHSYELNGKSHTFRIKYDTIMSTALTTDSLLFEIDSPFFKEIRKNLSTGETYTCTHVSCRHKIPLYFQNVNIMTTQITQYGKEYCHRSKIRILIDNGEMTEGEAIGLGYPLDEIY